MARLKPLKKIPKQVKLYGLKYDLYDGGLFAENKFENTRAAKDLVEKAEREYKKTYLKIIPLERKNIFGQELKAENFWVLYVRDKK